MSVHILSNIQDDVVSRLETDLGGAGAYIDRSEHQNEQILAEWAMDNTSQLDRYTHIFVYTGPLTLRGEDTTRRAPRATIPVRVFVMARDSGHEKVERQKKEADKWALATAASLQGSRFGDPMATNEGLVQNVSINPIVNEDTAAMWEVNFDLDLTIDLDVVLNRL